MTQRGFGFGVGLQLVALLGSGLGCASANVAAPARVADSRPASGASSPGGMCVSIARDAGDRVADTRIAEAWPDASYGAERVAFVGRVRGAREALMSFDLSKIPAGARVTKATLVLHRATAGASSVAVHRVTAGWQEASLTWRSFGESYDPLPVTSVPDGGDRPESCGVVAIDLTGLVGAWASGAAPNHGVLLKQDRANTSFATSEADRADERPRLEVCFETST